MARFGGLCAKDDDSRRWCTHTPCRTHIFLTVAACQTGRAAGAARAGSAAHGTDPQYTCVAGRAGRGARPNLAATRGAGLRGRHRAGDRSAQDLQP